MSAPAHPYYPLGLEVPNFQTNTYSFEQLIGCWLAFVTVATISTWLWVSNGRKLTLVDKLTAIWFVICGFIHLFFEGHFVWNHRTMAGDTDLFTQEWKEYSKADSGYLTSDLFVVCMEAVTAFMWGPLAFYIACGIKYNFPSRHALIALVSLGQMYGNVLYYSTTLMEGAPSARPEFMYFWVYFVGLNGIWIVVPSVLLTQAVIRLNNAVGVTQKSNEVKKVV